MEPKPETLNLTCNWCQKNYTLHTTTGPTRICPECGNAAADRILATKNALDQLRGLDEAGKICWFLGITREKLEELGGLGTE